MASEDLECNPYGLLLWGGGRGVVFFVARQPRITVWFCCVEQHELSWNTNGNHARIIFLR